MASIFTWPKTGDEWILSLQLFPEVYGSCFIASSSSGRLRVYSTTFNTSPLIDIKAHESSINAINKVNEHTLATASTDGIKVWDLRQSLEKPQFALENAKKSNFLSLGSSSGHLLAGGTELAGSDAELHLWDLRNPANVVRSFVDSHHDDITYIEFHPSQNYLMSGSTDGCVNIYNLDEPYEDEALHQVINFASVHSCHFTTASRILVLSHMETLGFFELNNTDYETNSEPQPNELGDLRLKWPNCEYVVDLSPTHVFYGSNLEQSLTVVPFDLATETFSLENSINFAGAHGDDVVRDAVLIPGSNKALTCGEDGTIKAWQLPIDIAVESGEREFSGEEVKVKKVKKEKKDKESGKGESSRHHKSSKRKSSKFKPY